MSIKRIFRFPARRIRGARSDSDGSVLVLAVIVVTLLAAAGISLLFITQTETKLAKRDVASKQSFFAAEAGLQAGREALRQSNISSGTPALEDELVTAAGTNGSFDLDANALFPTYSSSSSGGDPTNVAGYGDDVPLVPLTQIGEHWYMAFLSNDAVDGDSTTDTNDRVLLTAVGFGPDRSFEIVQAPITPDPTVISMPPAAITLLGPTPDFQDNPGLGGSSGGPGGTTNIGDDCNNAGVPGLDAPIVGAVGTAAENAAETGMNTANSTYDSGSHAGATTVVDITDPTEPAVITGIGTLDPGWLVCSNLQEMLTKLQSNADYYCNERGGDTCTLPATTSSSIIFIDGDLTLTSDGLGMLVVTGTLTIIGSTDWDGLILTVGEGNMYRNGCGGGSSGGAGGGRTSGATVVANISGPDDIYGNADDCTGGPSGFRTVSYHMCGGGLASSAGWPGSKTIYCTQYLDPFFLDAPLQAQGFRQR